MQAQAPRGYVRLPFESAAGLSITAHFRGENIWMGELAGSPARTSTLSEHGATRHQELALPPGPQHLACLGTTPSAEFPACRFAPAKFANGARDDFGPSKCVLVFAARALNAMG